MKDEQQDKKQQSGDEKDRRVNTPEPPQRKNPLNKSEAERDGDEGQAAGKQPQGGTTDREAAPTAKKEQDPPTTTTNRNSY